MSLNRQNKSEAQRTVHPKGSGRTNSLNVYENLLSAIESGEFPPGARLREVELAERLGISRTPVRDVLKRLEHQGLVVHEPHHGAVVATLDYAQTMELYQMREVLEGAAARMAAVHATEPEIALLEEMVTRDAELVGDPQRLAETNKAFHNQIRNAARNRYLVTMLESLRLSLALLGRTTLASPGRSAEALAEHRAIVERIAAQDPDGAETAARVHIRAAFRSRILLNESGPDISRHR